MNEAYKLASEKARQNACGGKNQYDKRAHAVVLQPGSCVGTGHEAKRGSQQVKFLLGEGHFCCR